MKGGMFQIHQVVVLISPTMHRAALLALLAEWRLSGVCGFPAGPSEQQQPVSSPTVSTGQLSD